MSRTFRMAMLLLSGCALSAGQATPPPPLAVQAAPAPDVRSRDYLELSGNLPQAFATARQLGPADAQAPMDSMILVLKPPPGAEQRLAQLQADQQDPASPRYHRWLTPEQFGAAFGPAQVDVDRVTGWLRSSGFSIGEVAAGRLSITFSGTVGQVERAFRTPIRTFEVAGRRRQGNLRNPSIPRVLADAVEGVVSLHNLPLRALNRGFTPLSLESAGHNLTPGDFAAIYDLDPLYRRGIDGTGVAIAIVGRTHIPLGDVAAFRKAYGLPARRPEVIVNGPDPGDLGMDEDAEADLDVEWSGAAARNADIRFVVSGSTDSTDGADLSSRCIVDRNLAPIMSLSFGQCETQMGAAERAFFRNLWAQAAVQGISVLVASGDSGPAGCEGGGMDAGSGPAVSGLASTPFNAAVGGTQFDEGSGHYWRSRKAPDQSSALGYIPEQAWNESGSAGGSGLWASGGGPSAFFPRPRWQSVPGVPETWYRCLPDVSLAAAGGHDGYVIWTGGTSGTVGGTSCSAPAFAGILALVVQKTGERQGNPCPALYALGGAQYRGGGPAVFHDVTAGSSTVPGTRGYPCTVGYDLATGLGSVDALALVDAWNDGQGADVLATILHPPGDLVVGSGTQVAFVGSVREKDPDTAFSCAWSFGDDAAAAGASAAHTFRNPGPDPVVRTVIFTATDGTGAQGTDVRTVTVLPAPAPGELVLNGGFEAGAAGWTARGVFVGDNEPAVPAHGGKGDAWFSGWQNGLPEVLRQTVHIPAAAASARLTFWLRIDIFGDVEQPVDCLRVKVRGADGRLATLATFSNLDYAPGYRRHSLDLGAYLGQEVQLSFVADDNLEGVNTSFTLDDVSLVAR